MGVQVVERWILAALRHRTFFSLAELNAAIAQLLERLNARAFHKLPGSRRSLFDQLDRPALRPLPTERYVFAEWKKVRVNIDYHVEVAGHYYSVPHTLARRQLDVRLTAHTVECLDRGQRVASHVRSSLKGRHTTADEHMPEKHRRMGQWTPERFIRWAEKTGPHTATLITTVLGSRRHPQQAFRSCLGILRLANSYGEARLEAAARRALAIGARSRVNMRFSRPFIRSAMSARRPAMLTFVAQDPPTEVTAITPAPSRIAVFRLMPFAPFRTSYGADSRGSTVIRPIAQGWISQ